MSATAGALTLRHGRTAGALLGEAAPLTPTCQSAGGEGGASPLVATLELAWDSIRNHHPEIAQAVIVVASGTSGGPARWGHFAASRWRRTVDGADLAEILVAGEGLERPPVEVLGTLLHEAAHALAHARGVKDCSRQGRYHNRRYRQLAEELGLAVAEVPSIGWSGTAVPAATAERYAAELEQLSAAMVLSRRAEGRQSQGIESGGEEGSEAGHATPAAPAKGSASCPCGRRIRASAATLADGWIGCGLCGGEFTTS